MPACGQQDGRALDTFQCRSGLFADLIDKTFVARVIRKSRTEPEGYSMGAKFPRDKCAGRLRPDGTGGVCGWIRIDDDNRDVLWTLPGYRRKG